METIKKEKIIKQYDTLYVAYDGTEFADEVECKKYEESAECVMLSKYKNLVVKSSTEFNIFNCGSDDGTMDIVKVESAGDVDLIMQTFCIINPHYMKESHNKYFDKQHDILNRALYNKDLVFVYRGYNNDSFSIEGTLQDRIAGIAKSCGFDIEYKLNKLDNETN